VPELLLKSKASKLETAEDDLCAAYSKAFVDANQMLHRHGVDDSMSGTTAISLHIRGKQMLIANVGDSRACMAERSARGKLVAVDLSSDQTPFRQDECDRVKKFGARVLTLDQLEGLKDPNVQCWGNEEDDDGDPPRLWAANGMYPGTAFTRSIGDFAAERIGVVAEPEILIQDLHEGVEFLVLASDGVFEFLPSQTVVDMVSKFSDPLEAALAVVAESYRLWLQYETRTDDITMVVIQVKGFNETTKKPTPLSPGKAAARRQSSFSGGLPASSSASRPVRRALSKAKRAAIETGMMTMAEDEEEWEPPSNIPAKSPEQLETIKSAVKANFLFSHLTDEKRMLLFSLMTTRDVRAGDVVIKQGDPGDNFYVVDQGEFDVYVKHAPDESGLGQLVHTYASTSATRPSFGELALMYGHARAATVKARSNGRLWVLDRRAFRNVLQKSDSRVLVKVLRSVEILQSLNSGQLQRLCDCLSEAVFEHGESIIKQGEFGDQFYIVMKGEVICTVRKDPNNLAEQPREVLRLGQNQYFGERALLSNAKRAANVVANGKVKCLHIGRVTFEEMLGPLQHIINSDRKWREKVSAQKEAVSRRPSVALLKNIRSTDFNVQLVLYTTDISQCVVAKHKTSGDIMTVRQISISLAEEHERQALVMRERSIRKMINPMPFIPAAIKFVVDPKYLSTVLHTHGVLTLDSIVTPEQPLDEPSAVFYGACLVLALEHIHMENCVFRGIDPSAILLDEDGHLQLVDFRFTKAVEGRTFTLCGNPEYMAPETVEQTGHTAAADWWALGCLIFWMIEGRTPFADEGDDDIKIYRSITNRAEIKFDKCSGVARDLIEALLDPEPNARIGFNSGRDDIRNHEFFLDIDWEAISTAMLDSVPVTPGIRERISSVAQPDIEQLVGIRDVRPGVNAWFDSY